MSTLYSQKYNFRFKCCIAGDIIRSYSHFFGGFTPFLNRVKKEQEKIKLDEFGIVKGAVVMDRSCSGSVKEVYKNALDNLLKWFLMNSWPSNISIIME